MATKDKKKHHYVPVSYLNSFSEAQKVCVYFKDEPHKIHNISPKSIGFERYYYSQPLPGGGIDNNRLEDLFGVVESCWPEVVKKLSAGQQLDDQLNSVMYQFMGLLRTRIPAARDPYEIFLANEVKLEAQRLVATGEIPPPPENLPNLLKEMGIAIDPHMSIHAMPKMMNAFAAVLNCIGFEIVHNKTPVDFATNDNPVMYFDPDINEESILPYPVNPRKGRIELLFPITPRLLLRGRSELPPHFPLAGLPHVNMSSAGEVRKINRMVCRFGYRLVFSNSNTLTPVFAKFADKSPILRISNDLDAGASYQFVFGTRPEKLKW